MELSATVYCRDVAAVYRHFPYPLDHLTGSVDTGKQLLTVDLHTLKAASRCVLKGTIKNPGVDAVVKLDIQAEAMQIDDALKKAMPPNVRKVVDQFNPSGVVKAHAKVFRKPLPDRPDRPEGEIEIDAEIDLTERCEITWEQAAIPDTQPERTTGDTPRPLGVQEHEGRQRPGEDTGQRKRQEAAAAQAGERRRSAQNRGISRSRNLPFSGELKDALPPAWKKKLAHDQSIG